MGFEMPHREVPSLGMEEISQTNIGCLGTLNMGILVNFFLSLGTVGSGCSKS